MAEARSEQLWQHTSELISRLYAVNGKKIPADRFNPHKQKKPRKAPITVLRDIFQVKKWHQQET